LPDISVLYFFYHSSCRKDQFIVVILKFGTYTEDLTDPGLLKIWLTLTGLSLWQLLSQGFPRVATAQNNVTNGTVA